mgnify:CR=1 FL=1
MNRNSRFRSWAIGAGLVAGLLISTVAQAHITLIESSPAADAAVESPTQVDLVFNEQLLPRASTVRLERVNEADPAEAATQHLDVQVVNGGTVLRAKPHHSLDAGTYRVHWRAVGEDNHPMTGEFFFSIE